MPAIEGQIVLSDVTLAFQLEPGVDQIERPEGRHLSVSQGGALHSEDQAVPSPLRLCGGPTIRSQMERGKQSFHSVSVEVFFEARLNIFWRGSLFRQMACLCRKVLIPIARE